MSLLEKIASIAKSDPQRIVLSEGEDERVVSGGLRATSDGSAEIVFLGRQEKFENLAKGQPGHELVKVIDPATSPDFDAYVDSFVELRRHKGMTPELARETLLHPLNFAAMMVREGDADGTIGGAQYTTSDTVRAALQIIGKHPDKKIVSSFFLMILNNDNGRPIVFADCALVIQPTVDELADIATSSAASYEALVTDTPKVAMLAFSTKGSATDESLSKVIEATQIAQKKVPSLIIDGELQFDTAFAPEIGLKKAPDSPLKGDANVFIFPNLHAGNIGYKIAQRIGGATAIGPILQGLAKPANDLSRGCTSDDVYHMIGVTGLQAKAGKQA